MAPSSRGGRGRLVAALAVAAAAVGRASAREARDSDLDTVENAMSYLWPATFWNMTICPAGGELRAGKNQAPLAVDRMLAKLAAVAQSGLERYAREILPQQLKVDAAWAAEFQSQDPAGPQLGFTRWQKRVFAKLSDTRVEELDWDGKPLTVYKGMPHKWDDFYMSVEFKAIARKVQLMASQYLNSIFQENRKRWKTFGWAEIFGDGEWQRPHVHTGAAVAGLFVARHGSDGETEGQKFVLQDARGPLFGQEHEHDLKQGELVMWPAWVPHYLTAHRGKTSNVYFHFLLWPPEGASGFDWEDDVTGDYIYKKSTKIKRLPSEQQDEAGGGGRGGEL